MLLKLAQPFRTPWFQVTEEAKSCNESSDSRFVDQVMAQLQVSLSLSTTIATALTNGQQNH
jgi:hypothetical protein